MKKSLVRPITYLITAGEATSDTLDSARASLIHLIKAAVDAGVTLIQIREKRLDAALLFSLVEEAASITRSSGTRLLVNDRVDVALAAGADGVHLTSKSIGSETVRATFGSDLLIAVSTHTIEEAETAARGGADLIVFGPVFGTPGKGETVGLGKLSEVYSRVGNVPVLGLGGVAVNNFRSVLDSGAAGFAAIRSLNDPDRLAAIVGEVARQR